MPLMMELGTVTASKKSLRKLVLNSARTWVSE